MGSHDRVIDELWVPPRVREARKLNLEASSVPNVAEVEPQCQCRSCMLTRRYLSALGDKVRDQVPSYGSQQLLCVDHGQSPDPGLDVRCNESMRSRTDAGARQSK